MLVFLVYSYHCIIVSDMSIKISMKLHYLVIDGRERQCMVPEHSARNADMSLAVNDFNF